MDSITTATRTTRRTNYRGQVRETHTAYLAIQGTITARRSHPDGLGQQVYTIDAAGTQAEVIISSDQLPDMTWPEIGQRLRVETADDQPAVNGAPGAHYAQTVTQI